MTSRRSRRSRGLTLVEVIVGSAVLGLLALAILSTIMPLTRLNADTTVALDMEQRSRALFGKLRPELRQSGYGITSARSLGPTNAMYLLEDTDEDADTLPDKLTFRRRTGPDDDAWSERVVISLTTIAGRRAIVRDEVDDLGIATRPRVVMQSGDIGGLQFADRDGSIEVTLLLERANPNRGQGAEGDVLRRQYIDRIQLMNRSS